MSLFKWKLLSNTFLWMKSLSVIFDKQVSAANGWVFDVIDIFQDVHKIITDKKCFPWSYFFSVFYVVVFLEYWNFFTALFFKHSDRIRTTKLHYLKHNIDSPIRTVDIHCIVSFTVILVHKSQVLRNKWIYSPNQVWHLKNTLRKDCHHHSPLLQLVPSFYLQHKNQRQKYYPKKTDWQYFPTWLHSFPVKQVILS